MPNMKYPAGKKNPWWLVVLMVAVLGAAPAAAQDAALLVPVARSAPILLQEPMAQVMIADPRVASVRVHSSTSLTVFGQRLGRTAIRLSRRDGSVLGEFEVVVSHDLPAIRRDLHQALPGETVSVEAADGSLAVSAMVGSAAAAALSLETVREYLKRHPATQADGQTASDPDVLNRMQIIPGYTLAPAAVPPPQALAQLFLRAIGSDVKTLPMVEGASGFMLD